AALDDGASLSNVEVAGVVAEACTEQLALAPTPLPNDGHHHAFDPGHVLAPKGGRGQDVHQWIDVQVVLLRMHAEVGESRGDGVVTFGNADIEVHDVAGMGNPLGAGHELVVDAVTERIDEAAVPASQ